MNTGKDSLPSSRLVIQISGIGNVPSFKNSKKIVKMGKRYGLITDPKKRKWMDQCERLIASQLDSGCLTTAGGILTVCSPPSLIALSMPEDDCWQQMEIGEVTTSKCRKGEEGATITIERQQP